MSRAGFGRGELAMALVPVLLIAITLVVLLDRSVALATVNAPLDTAINTLAVLVAIAVAGLGWVHFRETRDPAALLRASAFLALAVTNVLSVLVTVAGASSRYGLDLNDPGQLPILATILGRSVACALLLVAGVAAASRWEADRWSAALLLWGPATIVLGLTLAGSAVQSSLPSVIGPNELAALRATPTEPLVVFGARLLVALQVTIGLGYLAAALLAYRSFRRDGRSLDAFLAVGLIVAAFSQVQFAIHPGVYASLVTVGDLLRVLFYALLLLALAAESRDDVRALRRANAELTVLREADVARATADERARLAREIHDGMSQKLWFAKLKQARLTGLELPGEARVLAVEVADALEAAFAEARQAILALRPSEGASFAELLDRFVADFSDRFGIRTEASCDPTVERCSPRVQAELLRIAQEALTNAQRHADATVVRVSVESEDGYLRLIVADNGRGFDASGLSGGYGLHSMRERAELVGGTLSIDSGRQDGTRVTVVLPLPVDR